MIRRIGFTLLAGSLVVMGWQGTASAKKKVNLTVAGQQAMGLLRTGLKPVYPSTADCTEVSSYFGDQTRYDGSTRVKYSNNGFHGGTDFSLEIGTPLLAFADGVVIHKGTGGRLIGNVIWLRHSPENTGLKVWLFSKYQHLDKPTHMEVGDKVKMGQVIGLGGRTGTTGGHYGVLGYPHLHINLYMNDNGNYRAKKGSTKVRVKDYKYLDLLAVFYRKELDSNVIKALPGEQKTFPISYMTTDKRVFPADTKVVWPLACTPR